MSGIIDAIVNGLASVIKFFAMLGGNNTAIGIILFTIVIKLLLLPLTLKAIRSGRAMQQLQPFIKEINEKYKVKPGEKLPQDKAQKKQVEVMALYTEYGVNPGASCLPILIQIPIFFAVYAAVTTSIGSSDPALRLIQNAWGQFAPQSQMTALQSQASISNTGLFWFSDLTLPDPLFILPIIMVVFQFLTQRMAMPVGGGADDQQRQINKIMQWMPLIFGFTALNFPSGPVLYWATTSVFSFVQQYFVTGWGSLRDIPGLGFLPEKKLPAMTLKKREPTDKPVKPGLFQRLMENQERMQSDVATRNNSAADAGSEKIVESLPEPQVEAGVWSDEKPANNFGRKTKSSESTKVVKKESLPPGSSEVRIRNQEDAIRQAYQNNKQRPPKKNSSVADGWAGVTPSRKKKSDE